MQINIDNVIHKIWAYSLNHTDAIDDAFCEAIRFWKQLIFKSKWQWWARKQFRNTHWLTSIAKWLLPLTKWVFPKCFLAHHCYFDLKIHFLLAALALAVASAVVVGRTKWFKDPALVNPKRTVYTINVNLWENLAYQIPTHKNPFYLTTLVWKSKL